MRGNNDESILQLKLCTACRSVRYCNRHCQRLRRPQHKAECTRLLAQERLVCHMAGLQLGMTGEEVQSFHRRQDEMRRLKRLAPPVPPECPLCAHPLPRQHYLFRLMRVR